MRNETIYLYAAGGHAKVVFDSLIVAGYSSNQILVVDDDPHFVGKPFLETTIEQLLNGRLVENISVHVCIGNNANRMRVYRKLEATGAMICSVIHPSSLVSQYAVVGNGVFIAAKAVVAPNAIVGNSVIINHGAVVDHDCIVGDFCHIAPNVTLGGGVTVDRKSVV